MGPHFFKCGKCKRSNCAGKQRLASMGPHFFKCGKQDWKYSDAPIFYCFNGAALFQVRKVSQFRLVTVGMFEASMGPHFFKCGKHKMRSASFDTTS